MPVSPRPSTAVDLDLHPFGVAMANRNVEAAAATLSADVVFHSPIVFTPYHGRAAVAPILDAVSRILTDFRYVRSIAATHTGDHALVFQARIDDLQVEGCDLLSLDPDGLVTALTVMVRPLSAAHALADTMAARLRILR